MKKIFTLLAGVAVSAAGFAAVPNLPQGPAVAMKAAPEAMLKARASAIEAFITPELDDVDYTRTWTDPQGKLWDLSVKCYSEPMGQYFGLSYEEGVIATIEDLPYYPARYMLRKFNADQTQVVDGVVFYLSWPSHYVYDQHLTYEGAPDADGDIPADERDYSIVAPSLLMNNADLCRKFEEAPAGYVGGIVNEDRTGYEAYLMINNEWMKISGLYNGQEAMTIVDESTSSTVDFRAYDLSDNSLEVRNRIYLSTANVRRATISNTYSGIADVEGFEPRYVTTEDFGQVHVFNAGPFSSDLLGSYNVFTENFDEVTAFYVAAADQVFNVQVQPGATAFNPAEIKLALADPNTQLTADKVNYIMGYFFGDKKYGNDNTLDPTEASFNLLEGEAKLDEATQKYYLSIAPETGSFVSYGWSASWSQDYGVEVLNGYQNLVLTNEPNKVAWGTTEGFYSALRSEFDRFVTTKSTQDIVYHYDPKDMSKTRTFKAEGTLDPSAVETVVAENNAKVVARDGMILVNAAEKAPVAIFTLDGKLVKATEAANVAVEAAKGVYVVRVGNKATKVIL